MPQDLTYPVRLNPSEWPGFDIGLRLHPRIVGNSSVGGPPFGNLVQPLFWRYGAETRGAASEWRTATPHGTTIVRGMDVPWRASTVTPELIGEVSLDTNGAWSGSVRLPSGSGSWLIGAELTNGVRVFSKPIDVGHTPDLGIVAWEVSSPAMVREPGLTPFRLVISNGAPRTATGVVARIPLPSQIGASDVRLGTSKGTVLIRPGDALGGPRIEAEIGELAAGEQTEVWGAMEAFRVSAQPGQLLWAALSGDSGNNDQSNDFAVAGLDVLNPPGAGLTPIAFWRGEGDFLDHVGTNHAEGIGPVGFTTRGTSMAFRLGSPEAGIQLPARMEPEMGINSRLSLHLIFRLPLTTNSNETWLLASRTDLERPEHSYEVEHVDGVVRVSMAGQPISPTLSMVFRPYDLRDGQWHHLGIEVRTDSAGQKTFTVRIDDSFSFSNPVSREFTLAGIGSPLRLGGIPGRSGFQGDIDEIALFQDPSLSMSYYQMAMGSGIGESVLSTSLEGQLPFIPPDTATAGRPFSLAVLLENSGPITASNTVLAVRFPAIWTFLSEMGDGANVIRPGEVHLPVIRAVPGHGELRELRFLGPAGSNSVRVAFVAKPGVAILRRATIPVVISEDSDGDGLPDWWEELAGLSDTDPDDATLDTDKDGIDARGEFEAGTSPVDPASVLRLRWESPIAGSWSLSADSRPGRTYVLERLVGSFLETVWDPVQVIPGTGHEINFGPLPLDHGNNDYLRLRVMRDR